ncbi:hypothetical protein Hdeb2414_s0012g00387341 [Helianthus debilis subsp. tardiflorus]
MEASISLSFMLLLGHGPVLAEHGACSDFCFLFFALEDAVEVVTGSSSGISSSRVAVLIGVGFKTVGLLL